jgi:hypothetical protein
MQLEGLGKLKTFNDLIGTRIRDFPGCSIALNLLHYSLPPKKRHDYGRSSDLRHGRPLLMRNSFVGYVTTLTVPRLYSVRL